jgi:hypothetical protein
MEPTAPNPDSLPDTLTHIRRVNALMLLACGILMHRAQVHDESKLVEPEKSGFDRLKALSLSGMAYGSEEYRACLRQEKPAIDHHYSKNPHHPEFYPRRVTEPIGTMLRSSADSMEEQAKPALLHADEREAAELLMATAKFMRATADQQEAEVNGMSLFDLLEMLLDWKAASERMANGGDIAKSIEINTDRFKLSPQVVNLLKNTAHEIGWISTVSGNRAPVAAP